MPKPNRMDPLPMYSHLKAVARSNSSVNCNNHADVMPRSVKI